MDPDLGLMLRVFFSVMAFLTAAISSEIKAMVAAVDDGSGAGTTTCCGAPCAIV